MSAPVALFVYNRPDHTHRTVEALAANLGAKETTLWVFSDGPKSEAAKEKVEAVRAFVRTLPGAGLFGNVVLSEAPENRGLRRSIVTGVSEVMAASGRAIVLEDDLVTAPDFIAFMSDCLDFYEADPSVGSIAGYCPLKAPPPGYRHSIYAVPRSSSHGWATWKNRWDAVDWSASRFPEFWKDRALRRAFDACGSDRTDRLRREVERGAESWSVIFGFSLLLHGQNTIVPTVTRIRNIGDDGSGVHSFHGASMNDELPLQPTPYILEHVEPDPRVVDAYRRLYSGGLATRTARFLRNNGLGGVERLARRAQALFQTRRFTKSV